jgi:hypothetical protein
MVLLSRAEERSGTVGMRDWFVFDVGLSLTPVALVWLGSALVGRWSGWAGPLRDGQLCFFATALAAVTVKDVIGLGRTGEVADALARLSRAIDPAREAAVCQPLARIADVRATAVGPCMQPAPDIGLAMIALIFCLLLATFVFGVIVTENTRRGSSSETADRGHAAERRAGFTLASVAIAAITLFVAGAVRLTFGVWP